MFPSVRVLQITGHSTHRLSTVKLTVSPVVVTFFKVPESTLKCFNVWMDTQACKLNWKWFELIKVMNFKFLLKIKWTENAGNSFRPFLMDIWGCSENNNNKTKTSNESPEHSWPTSPNHSYKVQRPLWWYKRQLSTGRGCQSDKDPSLGVIHYFKIICK